LAAHLNAPGLDHRTKGACGIHRGGGGRWFVCRRSALTFDRSRHTSAIATQTDTPLAAQRRKGSLWIERAGRRLSEISA